MKKPLLVASLLTVLLVLPACREDKHGSIYVTPENEAKIMALYDARLATWPTAHDALSLPTRYGQTHVLASGPKDAPPVLLIHAMGITATMWEPNVAALSQDFRTYAIDTIGDLGRSKLDALDHYPGDGRAYGLWLSDVMDQLGIDKAHIVAASMGGWITMNFAIEHPQRVRSLALLGPLGINSSKDVLFRLMGLLLFPTRENKEGLTNWVLGENPVVRTAYAEYMNTALNCRSKLGTPGDLSDDQLRRLSAPVLIFLGGKDNPIGDARAASERAQRLIPSVEVEVFPESGHLVNTEHPEPVNTRIREFFLRP